MVDCNSHILFGMIVAQPLRNWGSLNIQRRIKKIKRIQTAISWNVIDPNSSYFSLIMCFGAFVI